MPQTLTVSASDGSTTKTTTISVPVAGAATSWGGDYAWTCSSGQNCQSVFDLNVPAGAVLNVRVSSVSSGSVSQIALYAPGVALGGINLLTGTTRELRCATGSGCSNPAYALGEQKNGITATAAGIYRFAVTRNWGISCGGSGTFRVDVTSSLAFSFAGRSVQDVNSTVTQDGECK